jgi:hypothetical protein
MLSKLRRPASLPKSRSRLMKAGERKLFGSLPADHKQREAIEKGC